MYIVVWLISMMYGQYSFIKYVFWITFILLLKAYVDQQTCLLTMNDCFSYNRKLFKGPGSSQSSKHQSGWMDTVNGLHSASFRTWYGVLAGFSIAILRCSNHSFSCLVIQTIICNKCCFCFFGKSLSHRSKCYFGGVFFQSSKAIATANGLRINRLVPWCLWQYRSPGSEATKEDRQQLYRWYILRYTIITSANNVTKWNKPM